LVSELDCQSKGLGFKSR